MMLCYVIMCMCIYIYIYIIFSIAIITTIIVIILAGGRVVPGAEAAHVVGDTDDLFVVLILI